MNSEMLAKTARLNALTMHHISRTSHIGSNFSVADILAVLYSDIMNYNPRDRYDVGRDRLIYSKGHAATIYYAILAEIGFFSKEMLFAYGQDNQVLASHVTAKVNGVEFSTGSLGHGLSLGCGEAIALKRKGSKSKVYVLLSDGEMNEGSTWEAMLFAAHHKLDNLIAILDSNKFQAYGRTSDVLHMRDVCCKAEAFGFEIRKVCGHSHDELRRTLSDIPFVIDKPSFILADTVKGKGVGFMEGKLEWHYKSTNEDEYIAAKKELEAL